MGSTRRKSWRYCGQHRVIGDFVHFIKFWTVYSYVAPSLTAPLLVCVRTIAPKSTRMLLGSWQQRPPGSNPRLLNPQSSHLDDPRRRRRPARSIRPLGHSHFFASPHALGHLAFAVRRVHADPTGNTPNAPTKRPPSRQAPDAPRHVRRVVHDLLTTVWLLCVNGLGGRRWEGNRGFMRMVDR